MCTTDRHDGSCATCETDEWVMPADLRRPAPASMSGPLAPNQPEVAHGPALTRDGFTEALLRRDGGAMSAAGRTAPSSDTRKRNAEAAQDPHPFTREWLRWVDESQHFTPTHPITQEHPMTAKDRHDELVALLTEIRDRLPEPEGVDGEPADITEEPPVGSQVTDRDGDVWERRGGGWALWWPERSGWVADLYEDELDPWPTVRNQAPLRFTTDEDRKRVGLPVDPAPAGDLLDEVRRLRLALNAIRNGCDTLLSPTEGEDR